VFIRVSSLAGQASRPTSRQGIIDRIPVRSAHPPLVGAHRPQRGRLIHSSIGIVVMTITGLCIGWRNPLAARA